MQNIVLICPFYFPTQSQIYADGFNADPKLCRRNVMKRLFNSNKLFKDWRRAEARDRVLPAEC